MLNLSLIGCYAVRGNLYDVYTMLVFGIVGYLLKLYQCNIVPILLGMILGPIAEQGLQQALILYDDNLGMVIASFLQRPICLVLLFLMTFSICTPFIMEVRKK